MMLNSYHPFRFLFLLLSLHPEEARSLASQFNGICRKMFPTAELATTVCRQQSAMMGSHGGQQQVDDRQQAIKNAMYVRYSTSLMDSAELC